MRFMGVLVGVMALLGVSAQAAPRRVADPMEVRMQRAYHHVAKVMKRGGMIRFLEDVQKCYSRIIPYSYGRVYDDGPASGEDDFRSATPATFDDGLVGLERRNKADLAKENPSLRVCYVEDAAAIQLAAYWETHHKNPYHYAVEDVVEWFSEPESSQRMNIYGSVLFSTDQEHDAFLKHYLPHFLSIPVNKWEP